MSDLNAALSEPAEVLTLSNEEGMFTVDSMPDTGILPKHNYRVHCLGVESKVSKSGNQMLVLDFEVVSPDIVKNDEGKDMITAKTRFKKWFVWAQNPSFKPNCQGLYRGFGLSKKAYRNMDDLQKDVTDMMTTGAKGSTFLWELYTEPQFKREQLTDSEKAVGKTDDQAEYVLDDAGNKIIERHEVRGDFRQIIGGFERFSQ